MAITYPSNNYTLGKGRVFFDPYNSNGATTGERYLGNCPSVELTVDNETLEHFSSESGIQEKDDEVLLRVTRTTTITCDNLSEENLALFLIGGTATISQTATPVVDESITVKKSRHYQLGVSSSNPSGVKGVSSVTVTGSGGTPTYVLDTDYSLDADLGRIYILPGGSITDDSVILVDYTPTANSRTQVASQSLTAVEGALRFVADNPKGTNRDLYAPKVQLKPNGSFQFIGEEWMQVGFTIEFLKKDSTTAAAYIDGRPA